MGNGRRIAVNSVVLYIKLVLSVLIGLYTSRVVLLALGVSDFGLYSVIGGFVSLLNILGVNMVSVSYRFMSVEIGKGIKGNPNKVFNTITSIHIFLALLLVILGLVIGRWYVLNHLNIELGKMHDALFVLYLSLLTTVLSVIAVPSNGLIIAREKFIFTSSIEVSQKIITLLFLIFILNPYGGSKLRLYASILALIQMIQPIAYFLYCRVYDKEIIKWKINRELRDYKVVFSFSGWLLLSSIAVVINCQGLALVLNTYFGTIINASYGVASSIQNYVTQFVSTLKQAAAPQITQSYSGGNEQESLQLTYRVARYTFFLMLIIYIPIMASISDILKLWLKVVPEQTNLFAVAFLLSGLTLNFGSCLDPMIHATGNVKWNQTGYSVIRIMLIPITCLLYRHGYPAYVGPFVDIILCLLTTFNSIIAIKRISSFRIIEYWKQSIWPSLRTALLSFPIVTLKFVFGSSLIGILILSLIIMFWTLLCIWIAGFDRNERRTCSLVIKNKLYFKKMYLI